MPHFGESSERNLGTAHPDLQRVFRRVIEFFDCKVTFGHRTPEEQFGLWKKGRYLSGGVWVVYDRKLVVTNCDGYDILSDHNEWLSEAVDVVPYPIDWQDEDRMRYFAGQVMATAREMGVELVWGGDWDGDTDLNDQTLMDLVHFARAR